MKSRRWLPLLTAMLASTVLAKEPRQIKWQAPPEAPRHGNFVGEPGISIEAMTEGFLAGHPDIRWRREALHDYANQRHTEAAKHFLRAARYGDKASQAMLAEMHWEGIGMPQDRALGYVWMDLAAERNYPNFLILRERYWHQLDETGRRDALARGQALYAEYGDEVAKPRLEKVMRREARSVTGSRTGFVGNLTIIPYTGPLAGTGVTLRADELYAKKYWNPEQYWQLQDEVWKGPPKGEVEVGELEPVQEPVQEPATQ